MKKFSFTILKVAVLLALAIPLAFASDVQLSESAISEPLFLSLCGVLLLVFGMMKSKPEEKETKNN